MQSASFASITRNISTAVTGLQSSPNDRSKRWALSKAIKQASTFLKTRGVIVSQADYDSLQTVNKNLDEYFGETASKKLILDEQVKTNQDIETMIEVSGCTNLELETVAAMDVVTKADITDTNLAQLDLIKLDNSSQNYQYLLNKIEEYKRSPGGFKLLGPKASIYFVDKKIYKISHAGFDLRKKVIEDDLTPKLAETSKLLAELTPLTTQLADVVTTASKIVQKAAKKGADSTPVTSTMMVFDAPNGGGSSTVDGENNFGFGDEDDNNPAGGNEEICAGFGGGNPADGAARVVFFENKPNRSDCIVDEEQFGGFDDEPDAAGVLAKKTIEKVTGYIKHGNLQGILSIPMPQLLSSLIKSN